MPSTSRRSCSADCASVTFDSRGADRHRLRRAPGPTAGGCYLLDPRTLDTLAEFDAAAAPARRGGNPFNDFAGGGYFYLDNRDRAVIPTTTRHLFVVAEARRPVRARARLRPERGRAAERQDHLGAARLDAAGSGSHRPRAWSARSTSRPARCKSLDTGEKNGNSFAVDDTGGVYIVTDAALYRFDAGPDGTPRWYWRAGVRRTSASMKPGQTQAGSGTTPTVMTDGPCVAITDNADPMNVRRLQARQTVSGSQVCCERRVRAGREQHRQLADHRGPGARRRRTTTATPGPPPTEQGRTTTPGIERVDVDADGSGLLASVWRSDEIAPSVVPKLSLANGLVYTYTKPGRRAQRPLVPHRDRLPHGQDVYRRARERASASTTTTRRSRSAPTAPPTWACSAASWRCATPLRRRAPPQTPGGGRGSR